MAKPPQAFTVLAIDGGGMRGLYAASLLQALTARFRAETSKELDVGKAFDLVVGTSTGGILAAGIVAGVPLRSICNLYKAEGPRIFKDPARSRGIGLWLWMLRHLRRCANDNQPLKNALQATFGDETIGGVYKRRRIGLCVPATSLLDHSPRVFKTPHQEARDLDNDLPIADVCLATSAAPIYLPIASTASPNGIEDQYVDGGLWANSPVLVGLLEALAIAREDQPIIILSVGTCPPIAGERPAERLNVGIIHWLRRILILNLVMNAQARASRNMVDLIANHLKRRGRVIHIVRCHQTPPSAEQSREIQFDLTAQKSLNLLEQMGNKDAQETYRGCQTPETSEGKLLNAVFSRMTTNKVHSLKEEDDR